MVGIFCDYVKHTQRCSRGEKDLHIQLEALFGAVDEGPPCENGAAVRFACSRPCFQVGVDVTLWVCSSCHLVFAERGVTVAGAVRGASSKCFLS